jgi:hypothetical protein
VFELAPVYDMLPMLYAPQNDQIVEQRFEPPDRKAAWLSVWARARTLAEAYWQKLSVEERISADFRALCRESLATLKAAR